MNDALLVVIGVVIGWVLSAHVWPRILEGYESGREYAWERLK